MRTKAMGVPRLAPLGAYAYYTHRASSTDEYNLPDVPRHHSAQRAVAVKLGAIHEVPNRYGGTYVERKRMPAPRRGKQQLTKWVVVWPDPGYGTVVGMTYRAEGVLQPGGPGPSSWDGPGEYEQAYLMQTNRWPLYEVRTSLTGPRLLVPPWALVPLPLGVDADLGFGEGPPRLRGGSGTFTDSAWAAHVAAWFTPHPRAVVPA